MCTRINNLCVELALDASLGLVLWPHSIASVVSDDDVTEIPSLPQINLYTLLAYTIGFGSHSNGID